jgi:hypothetical protein
MSGAILLRFTSWAFSIVLGSLGVFFVYLSFLRPDVAADAIICLVAATALAWAVAPDRDYSSDGRSR